MPQTHTTAATDTNAPCARGSLLVTLEIHAELVPPGVTAWHIREYFAAIAENREPHLHDDTYDAMETIRARVLDHNPGPKPPCRHCHGSGLFEAQACPMCGGEREVAS